MVHIENYRLTTPPWEEPKTIMKCDAISWWALYVLHLMSYHDSTKYTPEDITTQCNIFGEIIYCNLSEVGENYSYICSILVLSPVIYVLYCLQGNLGVVE